MDYHKLSLGLNFKSEGLVGDVSNLISKFYRELCIEKMEHCEVECHLMSMRYGTHKLNSQKSREERLKFCVKLYQSTIFYENLCDDLERKDVEQQVAFAHGDAWDELYQIYMKDLITYMWVRDTFPHTFKDFDVINKFDRQKRKCVMKYRNIDNDKIKMVSLKK